MAVTKKKVTEICKWINEYVGVPLDPWQVARITEILATRTTAADNKALLESFAKFKAAYPRPTGMSKAKQIWLAMRPGDELVATILAKIDVFKRTTWFGREQEKIPHATTFLNQRRWEDDPEQPSRGGRRPDVPRYVPPAGAPDTSPARPKQDALEAHVWKLRKALEQPELAAAIGADKVPLAAKALEELVNGWSPRSVREPQLAKIEKRLLELVLGRLSEEQRATCRQEAAEAITPKMAERMTEQAFDQARDRAYERTARRLVGLPDAF